MKKIILVLSVCAALIAVWGCKQENTDSDNYVYALYSGEKENLNSPMPTASYVYKYDYQGNLKDVYHLDKAAFTLAVKNDDSQLFTIVDDPNSKIFVYNLR